MQKVLVLCTGNSCRSVMAEALINALGKSRYRAVSAGSHPAGYVHPGTLATLARHGISVDAPRSKSWDEFENEHFDLVITVCDNAANETCPAYLKPVRTLHWSIPDPAAVKGSDAEIALAFDSAFEMLKARIQDELM